MIAARVFGAFVEPFALSIGDVITQHRHRRLERRWVQLGTAVPRRGHRDVPGEGRRPQPLGAVRRLDARGRRRPAVHRAEAAPGDRRRRDVAALPADRRPGLGGGQRFRGARPDGDRRRRVPPDGSSRSPRTAGSSCPRSLGAGRGARTAGPLAQREPGPGRPLHVGRPLGPPTSRHDAAAARPRVARARRHTGVVRSAGDHRQRAHGRRGGGAARAAGAAHDRRTPVRRRLRHRLLLARLPQGSRSARSTSTGRSSRGWSTTSTDQAIVRAVMAMAQAGGLDVTAEGVETVGHRDCLRALGCESAPGSAPSRRSRAAVRRAAPR